VSQVPTSLKIAPTSSGSSINFIPPVPTWAIIGASLLAVGALYTAWRFYSAEKE